MMRYSRVAALMMGAWLGASLLLIYLAANGLERTNALLAAPPVPLALALQTVPPANQRAILRYAVVDQNRFYFEFWENSELAIGFLLIAVLFLGVDSRLMS